MLFKINSIIRKFYIHCKGIYFEDFCEIASKEDSIREKDLIDAFHCIDINRDGFISKRELMNLLTTVSCSLFNMFLWDFFSTTRHEKNMLWFYLDRRHDVAWGSETHIWREWHWSWRKFGLSRGFWWSQCFFLVFAVADHFIFFLAFNIVHTAHQWNCG